ncbi:MFS transporter [Mycoavidus sp. B2-EB]|uniref:MFS transporter n=1 Tax=Mycoavidus sp. B2-EB TaxID=2651972 RepID=UPI0016276956|nr:MFS transporter [Mycoavidus sp. B2-EB]BBO59890.1 MFS transporter [Mycoavidus sp. B2-EB]
MKQATLPRIVWVLGAVSFFMSLSFELGHVLLPMLLVGTMGMSVTALGLIEGMADAMSFMIKVLSGVLSDYLKRRKWLVLLGYGLAALSKPLFPLAHLPTMLVAARLLESFGRGIRSAPRDALVADICSPAARGACFGLRQSASTFGAVMGALLALGLMFWSGENIRLILWFPILPAWIAVALVLFGLHEKKRAPHKPSLQSFPLRWRKLRKFSTYYWLIVTIIALFSMVQFRPAFILLLAQQAGLEPRWIPGIIVVMYLVYSLSAYPIGKISDRIERGVLLACGLVLMILADLLFGLGHSLALLLLGVILWGLHMGFIHGILAALLAEAAPAELRGTAFGISNLTSGVCMVMGSAGAGWLWDHLGSAASFLIGALLTLIPLLLCWLMPHAKKLGRNSSKH